jgi:hypothetical protein
VLADKFGLATAMQIAPLCSIPVIVALVLGLRKYPSSLRKVAPADVVASHAGTPR